MKTSPIILLAAAAAAAGVLGETQPARAQADVNPPLPNVMLLVDSSGSMEYKSSSATFPACDPTGAVTSEKSRWIELVEVLSGGIQNYRCESTDRSSSAFSNEYSLSGTLPADWQYTNPYHRPLSGTCTPGPGTLPANAFAYAPIGFHPYNIPSGSCTTFGQASDGLLDSFVTRVRFGLMTFDTHPQAGTGVSGSTTPDYVTGTDGAWSYFLGQKSQGKPAACLTLQDQEVGARNAAAPPWEGRMVAFGDPAAGAVAVKSKNDQIQEILLSTRPYGATPIAGIMDDARQFFWNDQSKDPLDPTSTMDFGPYNDPFVQGGCRSNYIVLLSDGEPNLDLRPFCEGLGPPAGACPYDKPEDIAFDLATAPDPKKITTFVIGFAVSNVTLQSAQQVDCETLTQSDLTSSTGLCATNPSEKQLQACCTLNRIAFNGNSNRAYFADDVATLRQAMSAILSRVGTSSTSRTVPVFASANNALDAFAGSYRFFTSFDPRQFDVWSGVIERRRWACQKNTTTGEMEPTAQDLDPTKGDDFVANVNSGVVAKMDRTFFSVEGDLDSGSIHSERTIRPILGGTDPDGISAYSGTQYQGPAATFVAATDPKAMSLVAGSGDCTGLTTVECRDLLLKWDVGLDNGSVEHRCRVPGAADCNLIGDVYHSTPQVIGRPSAFLRDDSYDAFAAAHATRPLVLYTSTNDGFLHAFKVAAGATTDTLQVDSRENNELWAFIPPAVLPGITSQYPGTHVPLLDGLAVVDDVVAKLDNTVYRFERSISEARVTSNTWRTVLVQGFGPMRGGYFAIDITDPVPSSDGSTGPKFLWQLTTDDADAPLFGAGGGTPLITTLFIKDASTGNVAKEVAVAVLPGGAGDSPTPGMSCPRENQDFSKIDSDFQPRAAVRCYSNVASRSLTIVRLDSGEIIRTFRRAKTEVPTDLQNRVLEVKIDSPITGQPVAFPGQTGAITDRIFVGDADGALWRIDTSQADPVFWKMELFWDAFPTQNGHDYADSQPISTPPVLSVDLFGNVTVALSTGDQEVLTGDVSIENYVWSVTEKPNSSGEFLSDANWYSKLTDGERVAGPMSLFTGALYYSSFRPEPSTSAAVCDTGSSRVWGVDYLLPKDGDVKLGGKERLPDNPSSITPTLVQFIDQNSPILPTGSVIFGVAVVQLPTCFEETANADPYFGTGTHTSITNINPGRFQLVMHTGNRGDSGPGGGITNTVTFNLASPLPMTRIDSWAAIVE